MTKRIRLLTMLLGTGLAACGTADAIHSQTSNTSTSIQSPKGGRTDNSVSSVNATGGTINSILLSGSDPQNPQNEWVLGSSGLAVTRNAGKQWLKLSPPIIPSDVNDVSVLPNETIILAGNGSQSLSISTLVQGQSTWSNRVIPMQGGQQVGSSKIVDANGMPIGVMVTLQSSSNFSSGVWISTPDGGSTWQTHNAPVGGTVTSTGGELWLVGGVLNSSLYQSSNNGATWNAVTLALPPPTGQTYALGSVFSTGTGTSAIMTATIGSSSGLNNSSTVVLNGNQSGSQWTWTRTPAITSNGSYGSGAVPTTAYANGTLWILTPSQLARVNISTSQVSIVSPDGLPAATTLTLNAINSQSAWISYSAESCSATKGNCVSDQGLSITKDGGQVWSRYPNPLV